MTSIQTSIALRSFPCKSEAIFFYRARTYVTRRDASTGEEEEEEVLRVRENRITSTMYALRSRQSEEVAWKISFRKKKKERKKARERRVLGRLTGSWRKRSSNRAYPLLTQVRRTRVSRSTSVGQETREAFRSCSPSLVQFKDLSDDDHRIYTLQRASSSRDLGAIRNFNKLKLFTVPSIASPTFN